jgi:hypothetical protein
MVMVSAMTLFVFTARSRASAGAALMVRSALDYVHFAAAEALAVTLFPRLVARSLILLFVPSARWWCTVAG